MHTDWIKNTLREILIAWGIGILACCLIIVIFPSDSSIYNVAVHTLSYLFPLLEIA